MRLHITKPYSHVYLSSLYRFSQDAYHRRPIVVLVVIRIVNWIY